MKKLCVSASLVLGIWSLVIATASAQVPQLINYQGRLLSGTNLVNGTVGLTLRLYSASSAGTLVYADSNQVAVVDGLYSTFIGDGTIAGSLDLALTNSQVWIEVVVNDTVLTPRERLVSVPYANMTRGLRVVGTHNILLNPEGGTNQFAGTSRHSTISGGSRILIDDSYYSVVAGGDGNAMKSFSDYSTIGGGQLNNLGGNANWATIGGGGFNTLYSGANYAVIDGGRQNTIQTGSFYSVVGGGYANIVNRDSVGGTIAGGWGNSISANITNSTIGGGEANSIRSTSSWSTVCGGWANRTESNAYFSIVAGGAFNTAQNEYATVAGGGFNRAAGRASFAAGWNAEALHNGAFVWSDASVSSPTVSTNNSSVTFRAAGGYRLFTDGNQLFGVQLSPFGTAWAILSDRNRKENFQPVDGRELLEKLEAMPVTSWQYRQDPTGRRYIGPVAQDFHAAFGLGNETSINTLDADGVLFVATKTLSAEAAEQKKEISKLQNEVDTLHTSNVELRATNEDLRQQIEDLARRMRTLEER